MTMSSVIVIAGRIEQLLHLSSRRIYEWGEARVCLINFLCHRSWREVEAAINLPHFDGTTLTHLNLMAHSQLSSSSWFLSHHLSQANGEFYLSSEARDSEWRKCDMVLNCHQSAFIN